MRKPGTYAWAATRREKRADWVAIALFVSLIVIGWLMVFAAGYDKTSGLSPFSLSTLPGRQLLFIGVAAVFFICASLIDWKFWNTVAYPLYAIGILGLILVLIFGTTIKGTTGWFTIGGFSLQPGEFAKFATCIGMASFLSYYRTDLRYKKYQAGALALIGLPVALLLFQPDAGSALVFASFTIVLFREGMPAWIYVTGGVLVVLLICSLVFPPLLVISALLLFCAIALSLKMRQAWLWVFALLVTGIVQYLYLTTLPWLLLGMNAALCLICAVRRFNLRKERQVWLLAPALAVSAAVVIGGHYSFTNLLHPHQQDRINVWLQPSQCDPRGSLYNVLQSKIAIGSGGLMGRGYLQGTMTNLNYVPEQATDFIFSTIGEEQGFIGSAGIIVLFAMLLYRIIAMAERMRAPFCKAYAYGVFGVLFFHFFINVGMTMGLVPIIGIPLPFISYGGSSLLAFTLMLSVLFKMDRSRYQ